MIFEWILFLNNPENGQNGPLEGQKLISNIDFKGHISILQAENTPTSCICKEKKNPFPKFESVSDP